jgi:hypothetical protein
MGNTSSFEKSISSQEKYVKQRKKDPDMQRLKHRFFRDGHEKYNNRQIEGYLRQEYHHTRKPDSFVLESDLHKARGYQGR